jgi:pimeloyl-ACP methyl ester carboxylesterase
MNETAVPRKREPAPLLVTGLDSEPVALHDFGGEGPNLLLVHATGMHGWVFLPMAERLRDCFHCWALDLRGHGDSPVGNDGDMHWSGFGRDVLAVVDKLGASNLVGFGHSLGGAALVMAASAEPSAFQQLLLYEPAILPPIGRMSTVIQARQMSMVDATERRRTTFPSRPEALHNFARKPPTGELSAGALLAYVQHGLADNDDGTVRLKCRTDIEAATYAAAFTQETDTVIDRSQCPVHVLQGTDTDAYHQSRYAGLATGFGTPLTLLDGLGHFGPLQNPAQTAHVVRRLCRLLPANDGSA